MYVYCEVKGNATLLCHFVLLLCTSTYTMYMYIPVTLNIGRVVVSPKVLYLAFINFSTILFHHWLCLHASSLKYSAATK